MKIWIVLPQGLLGEFAGWAPERAWASMLALAHQAEDLGVESVWVYDHLGTFGTIRDEPMLDGFAVLGALSVATSRVRFGPLVARASLRNPALLAKHAATLDVISGGRFELGLGSAAPRDETVTFGYDVLPYRDRVALLRETLAILRPALIDGRATFEGERVRARDAIVNPRGLRQPHIPLLVGGNAAPTVRVAAQLADELNLDGSTPDETVAALASIADICRDVGRDPASLAVSVHLFARAVATAGAARSRLMAAYAALGIPRIMALVPESESGPEALRSFIADARAADVELA